LKDEKTIDQRISDLEEESRMYNEKKKWFTDETTKATTAKENLEREIAKFSPYMVNFTKGCLHKNKFH